MMIIDEKGDILNEEFVIYWRH